MRRPWAFISDMHVLLVTHACAGSEWRAQCDGDATWCGDDDVACSPAAACGVPRSLLGDIGREGDGCMEGRHA
ncbi:hypothetical protein B0H14DRAFT_3019308 [Mycena olivaceomarginata]|nr:hypothetical protein B0H14DRAFT_3019308 [Mycena olivaceomarginata]